MMKSTTAISKSDIQAVLSKIRGLSHQTEQVASNNKLDKLPAPGFDKIISNVKNSLTQVSQTQNEAQMLKTQYLKGDPEVSLSQVLVSSTKSKVAFEGLVAIRKHFIEAYKEVMNMPL